MGFPGLNVQKIFGWDTRSMRSMFKCVRCFHAYYLYDELYMYKLLDFCICKEAIDFKAYLGVLI